MVVGLSSESHRVTPAAHRKAAQNNSTNNAGTNGHLRNSAANGANRGPNGNVAAATTVMVPYPNSSGQTSQNLMVVMNSGGG